MVAAEVGCLVGSGAAVAGDEVVGSIGRVWRSQQVPGDWWFMVVSDEGYPAPLCTAGCATAPLCTAGRAPCTAVHRCAPPAVQSHIAVHDSKKKIEKKVGNSGAYPHLPAGLAHVLEEKNVGVVTAS